MVEFGVLGPLTISRDGVPVVLRPPVLRRLLAVLLCRQGELVAADELADELWSGTPPRSARKTLQGHIHRIRKILGDERVQYELVGYRLVVRSGELDAVTFAALAEQARLEQRRNRLERAQLLFGQAAELWRGPAYADVTTVRAVAEEAHRLDEQRLLVLEDAAGVRLDLGRPADVVADLQGLVEAHPFRERLRALLMLALYRNGRQAEALEVFRRTRQLLNDELGVEPSRMLRDLHVAMLRDDDALAHTTAMNLDGGGTSTPAPPEPVSVRAPQQVSGLPRLLPAPPQRFTGRRTQLRALDELVTARTRTGVPAVVAITGTAGVGKTALAVHWAHRVVDRFPDGQLYVDLRGFDPSGQAMSVEDALRRLLDALAVEGDQVPTGIEAQVTLYRGLMSNKRMLVLLDNARDAAHVRQLLPDSPGCLAIVTSRNQLYGLIAAEGASALSLDVLTLDEARELFADRIGADRAAGDPESLNKIIELCARLPLALVVVSARAVARPGFELRALAAQLQLTEGDLSLFTTGESATDLRTVFSWSYHTLSTGAARVFRLLGLHPGPDVTAEAATSLAAVQPRKARMFLDEISRAHLVTEHYPGRYTFHDLLRAYALELAEANASDSERQAAVGRLLDHYMHTARAADRLLESHRELSTLRPPRAGVRPEALTDRKQAIDWFGHELDVLLAVTAMAAAGEEDTHVWELAHALHCFLGLRGRWKAQLTTQQLALEAARRLNNVRMQADCHHFIGTCHGRLDQPANAQYHFTCALELYAQAEDLVGLANTHLQLGHLLEGQDQRRAANDHIQRAVGLYETAGLPLGQALALNSLGFSHAVAGDHGAALTYCRRALAILKEHSYPRAEAATWDSLGYAHHQLGQHQKASACYHRAVVLCREVGDREMEAETLDHLGDLHLATSDAVSARDAWTQALSILEEIDHSDTAQIRAKLNQLTGR